LSKKDSFTTFEDAKKFVHSLELKSVREWRDYVKSGKKPVDITSSPVSVYKKQWKGFEDWLGYTANRSAYRH